jgi:ABC-type sulfate/molybdate transport systems ATPase subunit
MTRARITRGIPPGFVLDVDIDLVSGVTALFGPSAAGKTVILEAIAGFVRPDSGRILLDDVILFDAAARVSVPPRLRCCGYISHCDALFPHMTLRQNFLFAASSSPRLERSRRVAEMLERFRLTALSASHPCEASPPERLRGALARALLASPKLLLIDERGMDEALLRVVRDVFSGPILLVTNDLDLCSAAADQLLLLDAGRVVQAGSARAICDRPASAQAARLVGFPNILEGTIAALDPGRNTSRLEFDGFALAAPYLPGHFRGDRVSVAVRAGNLRVHSGDVERPPNAVAATLVRISRRMHDVRLEFSGGVFADVSFADFERQKDNKSWLLEFPPEALRVL